MTNEFLHLSGIYIGKNVKSRFSLTIVEKTLIITYRKAAAWCYRRSLPEILSGLMGGRSVAQGGCFFLCFRHNPITPRITRQNAKMPSYVTNGITPLGEQPAAFPNNNTAKEDVCQIKEAKNSQARPNDISRQRNYVKQQMGLACCSIGRK